ncbi:PREDICTED: LOW QUALITY PROTEIN: uncharacterized protein LOC109129853 [Camelina sativa]|uniref:LOW QUALITY PROTEIN: uncharacterized protein LOC109129853 n=1 Tax=Camelina sativa TaxID=90675 RepID=A0ABM1R5S1_CAMSA|nr:PREDICTED: LOW QUALITY PROTEIN: uncharacterized protein LOC109129853 [Camelina sativa]
MYFTSQKWNDDSEKAHLFFGSCFKVLLLLIGLHKSKTKKGENTRKNSDWRMQDSDDQGGLTRERKQRYRFLPIALVTCKLLHTLLTRLCRHFSTKNLLFSQHMKI